MLVSLWWLKRWCHSCVTLCNFFKKEIKYEDLPCGETDMFVNREFQHFENVFNTKNALWVTCILFNHYFKKSVLKYALAPKKQYKTKVCFWAKRRGILRWETEWSVYLSGLLLGLVVDHALTVAENYGMSRIHRGEQNLPARGSRDSGNRKSWIKSSLIRKENLVVFYGNNGSFMKNLHSSNQAI